MHENSMPSAIISSFAKAGKELWKQVASREIKSSDPLQALSWENNDGINFFPYYDADDAAGLEYLKKFQLTAGQHSFFGPRQWWCIPPVTVSDEEKANNISLAHLANGADGLFLQFNKASDTDFHQLLQYIEWSYCALFFHGEKNHSFYDRLRDYILEGRIAAENLTGALFWETSPKKSDVDLYFKQTKKFKFLGSVIPSSSPAYEIAAALLRGVEMIESLKDTADDLQKLFYAIAFSLPVDKDFPGSVSKLKSLRLLWYQVSRVYGIKNYKPADLHIHARTEPVIAKDYQPQGNMIKSTIAAMASVMGGCDSLTIFPEDEQNAAMSRIARNVSAILREESHLDKVADPVAGSYALDVMTNEISKKAWSLFQARINE